MHAYIIIYRSINGIAKFCRAVSLFFDENMQHSPVGDGGAKPVGPIRRSSTLNGFDASGLRKRDSCRSAQRVAGLTSVRSLYTRRRATGLLGSEVRSLTPFLRDLH